MAVTFLKIYNEKMQFSRAVSKSKDLSILESLNEALKLRK